MDSCVNEFLEFLSVEKGASGNTIAAYRNDLSQLEDFFGARKNGHSSIQWPGVAQNQVMDYILHLKSQSYAEATVARKVAAVKSFFSFMQAEGRVKVNPTETLASPKVGKSLPKPLTVQEIDELLEQPARRSTPEAKRDRAMLELMYATGLRVTELVSLDIEDINVEGEKPYVRLLGKGNRERQIPLLEQPAQEVSDYMRFARPRLVGERAEHALFVNRRGERLTRQGFWLILRGYAAEAGILGRVTPHTLRHSFATHMLRGGMDIHKVQELLGHANISTTQVYTQVSREHIREAYEKAHPRAH
ncbi:MAG TPA: site-specific tyrosine recombinase XerD [Dehalococcoidia bacterium]|nr:site-specific tyrosine recombinase XerD [Dehalococcoidia bacterium]